MSSEVYVKESPVTQGADEKVAYTLTTTPWGSTPTSVSLKVYDESDSDADVTDDVTTGSSSTSGDVITWPYIDSLTAGTVYRAELNFTTGGNIREAKLTIIAV